ncbi:DUF4406 domain-containing protein [Methylobacter sp.]|uniref:DUF4406 domain-containing protein n=1 Tax=Methylobacter sp. TaxID=2051955 RepID=UPI002487D43E|nr:DUF4406 domain-containing protein [Methylobacter sp.]MDI1279280.1 DUF4406 domain-containing protein [Methylobacter sp.]
MNAIRIYLAGPMSGLPDFNYPAFNQAAERLRGLGFHVENPAECAPCGSWGEYMRRGITKMLTCDCVAFLPGSQAFKGATIERRLAADLGIPECRVTALLIDTETVKTYFLLLKSSMSEEEI